LRRVLCQVLSCAIVRTDSKSLTSASRSIARSVRGGRGQVGRQRHNPPPFPTTKPTCQRSLLRPPRSVCTVLSRRECRRRCDDTGMIRTTPRGVNMLERKKPNRIRKAAKTLRTRGEK
jgi:hypothetical protein